MAANTSKETTIREIISIQGVPEKVFKLQNMGLSAGHVNAFDYCVVMMGFPSHAELLEGFMREIGCTETVTLEEAAADAARHV